MKEKEIFFYICVPVYKTEKYLRKCIESVLLQTYKNFCLILVDDGSPDNCGAICEEYKNRDNRLYVIHQDNQGPLSARNAAEQLVKKMITNSNKEFILYLDSDDTLCPTALETLSSYLKRYDTNLIIFGLYKVLDGRILSSSKDEDKVYGIVKEKNKLYHIVFETPLYNSLCRKAVSVSLLLDDDYDSNLYLNHGEDLLRSISYYKNSNKVLFIPDCLYNYEYNPISLTHSISFENYEVNSTVRKNVLDFLEKENVWNEEDYMQYFKCCRKFLCNHIRIISKFRVPFNQKKNLFIQILNDDYYSKVLKSGKTSKIELVLLKKKKFWLISTGIIIDLIFEKILRNICIR